MSKEFIPGIDLSDSQKRLIQNHLKKGEANKAQKIILRLSRQALWAV